MKTYHCTGQRQTGQLCLSDWDAVTRVRQTAHCSLFSLQQWRLPLLRFTAALTNHKILSTSSDQSGYYHININIHLFVEWWWNVWPLYISQSWLVLDKDSVLCLYIKVWACSTSCMWGAGLCGGSSERHDIMTPLHFLLPWSVSCQSRQEMWTIADL